MKVLITEDSDAVRKRLIMIIAAIPGVVVAGEAKNGSDAIEAIERLDPDIVVLDIKLPEVNGIDVLKKIKKDKPERIVIMLTNYPYRQYLESCKALGADYFFEKTGDFDRFVQVLERLTLDRSFRGGMGRHPVK